MNMNWGDSFAVPENTMSFPGAPTHQAFGFDTQPVPDQSFGFDTQVPDRTFGFDSQPVPDQTFGFDSQVPDQSFGFPGLGVTGQDYGKPRQDGAFSGACFRCGEVGHISRRCPRDNQQRLRGACRRCGEEGHYAKSCPMGPSEDWKGGGFGGGEGASFEIYREDVGRIIGKGGTKIRDLEKDSGARIKIARNEHPPRVLLFGSPEQCDLARRLIENLTSGNGRRGGAGDGRRANGDRGFDDSQRLDENLFR